MTNAVTTKRSASDATAKPVRAPRAWPVALAGLVLAAAGSLACLTTAGPLHGVLLGACGVVALLTPPLVAAGAGGPRSEWVAACVAAGVATGVAVGPVAALLGGDLNARLTVACAAVAASLAVAAAGLTALLATVRVAPAVAAALVTLLALAWLAWPVWLSPWLAGNESLVSWLSPAHPLLAVDAAVVRDGGVPWAEHRLMYTRLTVLGQHVFPRPPAGVGPAAALHLGVGSAALGFVRAIVWFRARRGHARWWRGTHTMTRSRGLLKA